MCKLIVEPKVCRCSNDTDCPNRTSRTDKEFPGHLANEITRTLVEFCNWGIQQLAIPGNILPERYAEIKMKEELMVVRVPDCPRMEEFDFTEELYSSPVLCQSCWEHRCYLRLTRPLNDPYWSSEFNKRSNLDRYEIREMEEKRRRSRSASPASDISTARQSVRTVRESESRSSSRSSSRSGSSSRSASGARTRSATPACGTALARQSFDTVRESWAGSSSRTQQR